MNITFGEAVAIIKEESLGMTVPEFAAKYGFEVTAGAANVDAVAAKPAIETNPERVAAAALLFKAGVKRAPTKHAKPRPKRTLGDNEGTYPYKVAVTIDPDYTA